MAGSLTEKEVRTILGRYPDYAKIRVFVETGTLTGMTISRMRALFTVCHTIELSKYYYLRSRIKYFFSGIHFHLGDSVKVLARLAPKIKEPAVFFLDAHWSSGKTARGAKDCPLLEEMRILSKRPYSDLIIVDDARLFGTNEGEDWSQITQSAIMESFGKSCRKVEVDNDRLILAAR